LRVYTDSIFKVLAAYESLSITYMYTLAFDGYIPHKSELAEANVTFIKTIKVRNVPGGFNC
jgi:hypothetical protein